MISKKLDHAPIVQGDITIPITPLIEGILNFVDAFLPLFPASIKNINPPLITEKLLNQQLVDFFNGHSSDKKYGEYIIYKFIFRKDDERSDTQARPDIGVTIWNKAQGQSDSNSFFQIECKRLPTPGVSVDRSETEYVRGTPKNKGGIERFKRNEHGFHINEAALIGYVQDNTLDYWINKISEWINLEISNDKNDLKWLISDHLVLIKKQALLNKYISTCGRENKTDILLYHFLINVQ